MTSSNRKSSIWFQSLPVGGNSVFTPAECLERKLRQLELSIGTTRDFELLFDILAWVHSLFSSSSISILIRLE